MDETVKELLKNVRVAAPCAERWEGMPGSDAVRSCERCRHKVYNLSEMTAPEAADLLRKAEGRLCVRFYRRPDGTIMTKDCPVGLQAVRQRMARTISVAFASLLTVSAFNLRGKPRSEYPILLRLVLNVVAPESTTCQSFTHGHFVHEELPSPTPRPTVKRVAQPLPMMGVVAYDAPRQSSFDDAPAEPVAKMGKPARELLPTNKKFLQGLPVQNDNPREDPFAKPPREKKATR